MIPSKTLNALQTGFGHFGVASKENKTRHVDTLGSRFDQSNDIISCFFVKGECVEIIKYLNDSGRVSLFVGMVSHEAYNFKGKFIECFDLSVDDIEYSKNYLKNVMETVESLGLPREAVLNKYDMVPDIGIRFKVDKVFVQTPGPEAGKEIM